MIGMYLLGGAAVIAGAMSLSAILAASLDSARALRITRWGFAIFTLLIVAASGVLLHALYASDFKLAYVANYTERALPLGYKLSAFWAGQEGSLLFWTLVLAVMAWVHVIASRRNNSRQQAITLASLAVICAFFAALMVFAANPFKPSLEALADGHGLNPMLQDIAMIAHPPTLFLGYAGFTIPFALMLGALISGNTGNEWLAACRRWTLASWVFLTIGIVLGAEWAYVELGWGGYWAWDPVENASLLPWLTGTALLHSIIVQQHRSMFRTWNATLAAGTFLLCIFGTYLTRSGIIQSVHSFQPSLIATFFLIFLGLCTLFSAIVIAARYRKLRYQPPLESFITKEGVILVGNTMLVVMMALTLLGTIFPLITELIATQGITVTQKFYNRAVLPFSLLLLAMMGIGPLLGYGTSKLQELRRRLIWPTIAAIGTVVVLVVFRIHSGWAIACGIVISLTLAGILADVLATIQRGQRNILVLIDSNHRRYGGYLAHIGVAMIVAGVAGSSLYSTKTTLQLHPGESAHAGRYHVQLDSLTEVERDNHTALQAALTATSDSGARYTLHPEVRKYAKSEQANAEVAIRMSLTEDLYLMLMGVQADTHNHTDTHAHAQADTDIIASVQVITNPLVSWIWFGGIAMTLGGIWCLLPSLRRAKLPVAELADVQAPSPTPSLQPR